MALRATLLLLLLALPAHSATIRVPGDYPRIKPAVFAAAAGDTVEVACGTYYEAAIEIREDIVLRSVTGTPDCVTINARERNRVLKIQAEPIVLGFTLRAGNVVGWGGGISCLVGSPRIENCVISGCSAQRGGGIYAFGGTSPEFDDCAIVGNMVTLAGAEGGGIYCAPGATVVVRNSTISSNSASEGSGVLARQAQLVLESCTLNGNKVFVQNTDHVSIRDCSVEDTPGYGVHIVKTDSTLTTVVEVKGTTFVGNQGGLRVEGALETTVEDCAFSSSSAERAAILRADDVYVRRSVFEDNMEGALLVGQGTASIEECSFRSNSASRGGALRIGGQGSATTVTRCLFAGNFARNGGGAVYSTKTDPSGAMPGVLLESSTFFANATDPTADGSAFQGPSVAIVNCILASNEGSAPIACRSDYDIDLECSDLYGNAVGDWIGCIASQANIQGNFSADPVFCDLTAGKYSLAPTSPCLPGNHPDGVSCGLVGAFGEGCTSAVGARRSIEVLSWGRIKGRYR